LAVIYRIIVGWREFGKKFGSGGPNLLF
jgi:hypothetical protein